MISLWASPWDDDDDEDEEPDELSLFELLDEDDARWCFFLVDGLLVLLLGAR